MREKPIIIICVTILVCVSIICGTILLIHQNMENDANNTSVNNTTVNSTQTDTNNTTDITTEQKSASTSKSASESSSSSSYSSQPTGDNVPTVDANGNRIFREGQWVGRGPGGAHIYKDPRSGELFGSGGSLPSNYKYDPI
ncbi:MAG: hypothetical protein J6S29_07025 [Methanosphaera sp.]|nr:hypothetical protein [Methanosphaera sp.]